MLRSKVLCTNGDVFTNQVYRRQSMLSLTPYVTAICFAAWINFLTRPHVSTCQYNACTLYSKINTKPVLFVKPIRNYLVSSVAAKIGCCITAKIHYLHITCYLYSQIPLLADSITCKFIQPVIYPNALYSVT